MLAPTHAPDMSKLQPSRIEDYESLIGADTIERILSKAERLKLKDEIRAILTKLEHRM